MPEPVWVRTDHGAGEQITVSLEDLFSVWSAYKADPWLILFGRGLLTWVGNLNRFGVAGAGLARAGWWFGRRPR